MSTIKVDTIQTRSGVSEIGIDKLKGASSASSISVVGEGGTTTTNLQQGLAKSWVNIAGQSTPASLRDSFNISSLTDVNTGDYTPNFSNNMSNDDYACGASRQDTSTRDNVHLTLEIQNTSDFNLEYFEGASKADCVRVVAIIAGDLA